MLLPEVLKIAGYTTGLVGKWHLGYTKESLPTRHGFDEFVGFIGGTIDYFDHTDRLENHDLWRNETQFSDGRYFTDLVVDEAIDFLDRHSDEAFFLFVSFSAPHHPYQGPEDRDTAGKVELTRQINRKTRAVYRSMVEALDNGIGQVLGRLEALGLADETVIFFMSDNGGRPVVASNAPFSGHKESLREGGIRTPLIVRWTNRVAAGTISDALVAGMDLFPTIVALSGASIPEGREIDGLNLLPILTGDTTDSGHDALYFHYRSQRPKAHAQHAMIRDGWKYLLGAGGKEHLFDLTQDKGESENLSAQHPAKLARLKEDHSRWRETVFKGVTPLPPRKPPQRLQ